MKKILIIEDEQFLSELYRMKLEKEGYKVVVAWNGEEGLEKAKKEKPDLILLDIIMPKIDGYQVLAEIRSNPAIKKTKVYILSNLGQREEIEKGLKLGADDYLVKTSVSPTQLAEIVKVALKIIK